MAEDDAEEIRRKKIEEYKKREETANVEEQLKTALRIALEDSAYERLMNVSYANKELYVNVAQRVLMAFRQARRKISEDEVLYLIRSMKGGRETKITFLEK